MPESMASDTLRFHAWIAGISLKIRLPACVKQLADKQSKVSDSVFY